MKKSWVKYAVLLAGFLLATTSQAALKEGKEFKTLPQAHAVEVPGKLEVIEFFWYGCPHCKTIEPFVHSWAQKLPKDVNFRRVHVMWPGRPDIEAHAKIFVALRAMGLDSKYQQAVMDAVQRDRIELRRDSAMNDWLKKQGIDQAKFRANYDSFNSGIAMKKLEQLSREYAVDGVPMFIVNGKYVTSPVMVGKEDGTITQVIDELLTRERNFGKKK